MGRGVKFMKKRLWGLMLVVVGSLMIGCIAKVLSQENISGPGVLVSGDCAYNRVYEEYANQNDLGIILNEPSLEILAKFEHLETYKDVENGEKLLVIPKYKGSQVIVQRVELEGNDFVVKDTVYNKDETEEKYGLLLETARPEGIPYLNISISSGREVVNYLVSYNGKTGTPDIEYLTIGKTEEVKEHEQDQEKQVIQAITEGNYLDGYNLLHQDEVDIDYDEEIEILEVYSIAGYNEDGRLMLDDGQEWALIIREGDQIYPIFPKTHIQLGRLEYKVYTDYDEEIFHILISKIQGAGITMYDCYYDQESNTFISKVVYETTGNVGVVNQYPESSY